MKKGLKTGSVKTKKRNAIRRNINRAVSFIFSITILSVLLTDISGLSVQAAEGTEIENIESGTVAVFETLKNVKEEKDQFDRERVEDLHIPVVELQDYLDDEISELEDVPQMNMNYSSTDTYPWGKAMDTSQITLVAPDSTASSYQWQVADRETGEFTSIPQGINREYTFTPISGKWYRVVMGNSVSRAVQVFQAPSGSEISGTGAENLDGTNMLKTYSTKQWYVTNGVVAYTSVSNGSAYMRFDVLGKYTKNGTTYWMNTAYSNGWQLFTENAATPNSASATGFGDANLKELRFRFEEDNKTTLHIEAVMESGVHAFCFGSDVMLGTDVITRNLFNPDWAALTLTQRENGMKIVQMVGAQKPFDDNDPAVVLNYTGDSPDKVWLGFYSQRMAWANNNVQTDSADIKTDGEKVIQYANSDSGMTSSWLNLPENATVKFSFNVGNVVEDNVVDTSIIQVRANPVEGGTVTGGGGYNKGASVTVTAEANSGYEFTGWTENGVEVSRERSYCFTAETDRNLVAEFQVSEREEPEPVYTIQLRANPAAGGTVTGGGSYNKGASVTVTAEANSGYEFTGWTENGVEVSKERSYCFTAETDRNLVAEFQVSEREEPEPVYAIQLRANPAEGGAVTGGGSYNKGASVTVTAEANSGYEFTGWTENGMEVSKERSYCFTAETDRNLVAEFRAPEREEPEPVYTIQLRADPAAGGTVTGGGSYNKGASVTVTAEASSGYEFTGWTENGMEVSTDSSYSFTSIADRNLVAHFLAQEPAETEYTITFDANGGRASIASAKTINKKLSELPIATRSGYTFDGWYTNTSNGAEVTISTEFDHDTTVYAQWTKVDNDKDEVLEGNHDSNEVNKDERVRRNNNDGNSEDDNELDDMPKTGDTSELYFWFPAAFLSGLGVLYFGVKEGK